MKLISAVVLFVLLGSVTPHYIDFGKCSNLEAAENFDPAQLEGTWYVLKNVGSSSGCMTLTFERTPEGFNLLVEREPIIGARVNTKLKVKNSGSLTLNPDGTQAKMDIDWRNNLMKYLGSSMFTVTSLNTEEEYASIVETQSALYFWCRINPYILSRNKTISETTMKTIEDLLARERIKVDALVSMEQDKCLAPGETGDIELDLDEASNGFGILNQ